MSSRVSVPRSAALIAAGMATALAACGATESVDQDALESGVVTVAQRTADVESASCPDDVSSEEGTEFECVVTNAAGEEVPVTATITGVDGEDVLFEIQSVDGVDITK